jgi:hypothetical protein
MRHKKSICWGAPWYAFLENEAIYAAVESDFPEEEDFPIAEAIVVS